MAKKAKKKRPRTVLRVSFYNKGAKKDVKNICRRLGKVRKDTTSLLLVVRRGVPARKAQHYLEAHKPEIVSVEVFKKKTTKKNKAAH